jgi:adenylate cyclase
LSLINDRQSVFTSSSTTTPPSEEQVRAALARVLRSTAFRGSDIGRRFLGYVVTEALAGRVERLKAYGIAVGLLGRPTSFDPTTDPLVRVQANRVRNMLDHYYLTEGHSDSVRIDMPPGSYCPIFSYAQRSGLHAAAPPVDSEPIEPVIAIVPLRDLSDDGTRPSFAHGLSQELLAEFTRLEGLRVVPWPAEHDVSTNDMRSRNVRLVLTGSVHRTGEVTTTRLLLSDVGTGEALWSEAFPTKAGETAHEAQHDLSVRIACLLGDMHGVIPRALIRQYEGIATKALPYNLAFIRYCNTLVHSREEHMEIIDALEHAVESAPNCSLANTYLADECIRDHNYMFEARQNPLDRALALAQRAVALDPASQSAEMVLAYTYARRGEFSEFSVHAERSLQLNPACSAIVGIIGQLIAFAGNWDRGLLLVRRAMELNPRHMSYLHLTPFLHHYSRREYDQALREAHLFGAPGFFWGPLLRAAVLGQEGRHEEGRAAVKEMLVLRPDFVVNGRSLTGRFVPGGDLLDKMMEGLEKAGYKQDGGRLVF